MDTRISTGEASREADLLDLEHLARCSQGDQALERELLSLYMAQARQQVLLVKEAQDKECFASALHTLRGSALALGAGGVAAAAEGLERAGFDAARHVHAAMLARLERDVVATENCIRRHLARGDRSDNSALP